MPPQDTTLPGWMHGSPAVQTLARTLLARYPAQSDIPVSIVKKNPMNYPAASCEVSTPRLRTVMAPPVWRGGCSCILCMSCMRTLEQS